MENNGHTQTHTYSKCINIGTITKFWTLIHQIECAWTVLVRSGLFLFLFLFFEFESNFFWITISKPVLCLTLTNADHLDHSIDQQSMHPHHSIHSSRCINEQQMNLDFQIFFSSSSFSLVYPIDEIFEFFFKKFFKIQTIRMR